MKKSELRQLIAEEIAAIKEEKRNPKALQKALEVQKLIQQIERPFTAAYGMFKFKGGPDQDLYPFFEQVAVHQQSLQRAVNALVLKLDEQNFRK